MTEKRRIRGEKGDGCIRKTKSGSYEGSYTIHKKDGTEIRKSFTRKNRIEVKDIIAHLKVLEPIDEDVIKVDINKTTNKILLIKKEELFLGKKVQLDKNILVDDYVDYWLWFHRRKGETGKKIKNSTFNDYVDKANLIKRKIGQVKLKKDKIQKIKVNELTFDFIADKLTELYEETAYSTTIQVRNHIFNMMKYAKKDGVIDENPLADETIKISSKGKKFKRKIVEEKDIDRAIKYCLKNNYMDVFVQIMTGRENLRG